MSDHRTARPPRDRTELPEAQVGRSRLSWLLWLIPIAAVLFCGWLLYRDFVRKGPTIHIRFSEIDQLDPGNTPVKFRGAEIGKVTAVHLAKDRTGVDVTAELTRDATALARKGALFWIVKPEVKVGSVRALQTIVSGNYIAVAPGNGPPADHFVGAEQAPVPPHPGLHITLLAPELGSLQVESPIFYKGIEVGKVLSYQLADDAQDIVVRARIEQAYAPLVRRNSKFWNAGGLHLNFSLLHGADISALSPEALIAGAIEFSTPPQPEEPATDNMPFRLYEKPDEKWKTWAPSIPIKVPVETQPPKSGSDLTAK